MHFFRKSKPKEKKAWVIEEVHENLEYNSDESNDGDNNDGGTRKGKNDSIPMLSIQSNTNNDNDTDNAYATTHHNNNPNSIINSPVKKKQQKQKKKKKKWQQTMPLENKIEKTQAEEERSIIQYPGFMKLQYKSGAGQLGGGKKTLMKKNTQPSTTHREASELTCIRSNRTNDNDESMEDDTSISRLSLTSSTTTTTEAETATIALTRTPSVPAWTYATRQDYEAHLSDNVNIASLSYWTGGFLGEESNNNSSSKNQNNNQNNDKNSATMPANDNVIDVGSSSSSSASPNTNTRTRSSNITNTNSEISTAVEEASATHNEPVLMAFTSPFLDRTSSSSLRSIPEEDNEDNEEEEEDEDENQDVKALQEKLCALHTKIAIATEAAKQRVKEKHKNNTIELVLVEADVQGGPLSTNCYGPHFLGNTSLGAPQQQQQSPSSPSPSPSPSTLITRPTTATALLHKLKFVGTAKKEEKSGTPNKSDVTATIVSCSSTTTSPPPSLIVGAPSHSLITCTSQEFYAQEDHGGGSIILDSVAALKSVLSNNNVSAAEENHTTTNTEERKVKQQEKEKRWSSSITSGGSNILDSVAALKSVLSNNNVSAAEENITSRNNTTKDHRGSTILQPGVVDAVATTSLLESINRISNIMCAQCTPISPEKKKQYGDYNDIKEEEDRDDVDENGESSSIVNNTLSERRYSRELETRQCQSREEVAVVEDHDNYDVRIIAEASTLEDQYYDNDDDRDDDRDDVVDDDNNNDHRNYADMEGKEAVNQPIVGSSSTSTCSSSSSSPDATPEQQQIRSLQKTIEELKASLRPTARSSPDEEASTPTPPTPAPVPTPTPPPPPTPPTPVLVVPTPLLQPLLVRNHDTRNEAAWKRCAPRSQCDQKTKAVIQFPIPKKIFSPNETDEKKGVNSNDKKGVNNSKEGSRSSLWYTNFFERFPSLEGISKTKNAVAATTTTTGEILESSE